MSHVDDVHLLPVVDVYEVLDELEIGRAHV
jgi:hypothetical protein